MREAELTPELVVAMLEGLQDKKKGLEGFYERWDDDFPNSRTVRSQYREIIDLLEDLVDTGIGTTADHAAAELLIAAGEVRELATDRRATVPPPCGLTGGESHKRAPTGGRWPPPGLWRYSASERSATRYSALPDESSPVLSGVTGSR